ncbi:MAG: putative bifunctional diguanylate cyclase/phosphodiesterase [Bryobacteraceae bacterium]
MNPKGKRIDHRLSAVPFEELTEELLKRLYARRLEITHLLQSLDGQNHPLSRPAFQHWAKRFTLAGEVSHALEERQFVIHYQPQVHLTTRKLVGFEALVRWRHPTRGLVRPDEFVAVAEETGLIIPLGDWVLDQACRQLSFWRQEVPGAEALTMHVNVASAQIGRENTPILVDECLDRYKLPPEALHLEITETSVIDNPEVVARTLEKLRHRNVQVWLDDFGTGHSSLSSLHRFALSGLKIDRSFVGQMEQPNSGMIIKAILALSHSLGLRVTAEGIETARQADELEKWQCEFGQGYYFSKPVSARAATKYLFTQSLGVLAHKRNAHSEALATSGLPRLMVV